MLVAVQRAEVLLGGQSPRACPLPGGAGVGGLDPGEAENSPLLLWEIVNLGYFPPQGMKQPSLPSSAVSARSGCSGWTTRSPLSLRCSIGEWGAGQEERPPVGWGGAWGLCPCSCHTGDRVLLSWPSQAPAVDGLSKRASNSFRFKD